MHIDVVVADAGHAVYADEICEEVFISARAGQLFAKKIGSEKNYKEYRRKKRRGE